MPTTIAISTVVMRREQDILLARQRARQISQFLGFSAGDATRITTALSEVARNAFEYAGAGTVAFSVEGQPLNRQDLVIRVTDEGPGIADIPAVLRADYKSRTGMGIGIKGSRALMDRFVITSTRGKGTVVEMAKSLPWSASQFGGAEAARLVEEMITVSEATPLGELQIQNQALLNALQELTQRQAEIERLQIIADQARESSDAAQRVAARSLVVRERFMALTTHEFRTPLNAILGYLDLLDFEIAASITDKQKGYLARVQRACKHLVGVTNDFLDMAQGEAGRLRIERKNELAKLVMAEALALVAPQAAARNVAVRLTQMTAACMFLGDADRVRQVLVNVLGNAVSFTPAGGTVEVIADHVSVAPEGIPLLGGPWCTIRVEDMGPGIPPDKLEHVFEPFVQLSSDGQVSRQGTGLGLTVSRQLALLMGGDLTAGSTGTGAVFTLWLAEGSGDRPAESPHSGEIVESAASVA